MPVALNSIFPPSPELPAAAERSAPSAMVVLFPASSLMWPPEELAPWPAALITAVAATVRLCPAVAVIVPAFCPEDPSATSVPPMLASSSAAISIVPFWTTTEPPCCKPSVLTVAWNSFQCLSPSLCSRCTAGVTLPRGPAMATLTPFSVTPDCALTWPRMKMTPSDESGTVPAMSCAAAALSTTPALLIKLSMYCFDGVVTVRLPTLMTPPAPTTKP